MNTRDKHAPARICISLLAIALWSACLTPTLWAQFNLITTVAGNGNVTSSGDGFAANSAGVPGPRDVAIDSTGNLYISSSGRIRRVLANGTIETFANLPLPTQGGFPIPSQTFTTGITFWDGSVYAIQISSLGSRVLRVGSQGNASVFLNPGTLGFNFGQFSDLVMDGGGNLFIADSGHHRVIRRSASDAISIYAGRTDVDAFGGDDGAATAASLNTPAGLAIDHEGNLYIADSRNHRVRKVNPGGTITTFAGSGGPNGGFSGDGGPATAARLNFPRGLAVDSQGNVYIGDAGNSRVRRVDTSGIITTVAGSGDTSNCFFDECFSGDNGQAVAAQLSSLQGIAVDDSGNLYLSDSGNNRIRKVTFNAPANQRPPPAISSVGGIGVQSAAPFQSRIAAGSWATIYGQNLAPVPAPGRVWRSSEIVDGKLPTSLEGVSVRFNGKLGFLYFIGPGQLNVLVPDDIPLGIVGVEVETPSGTARTNADVRTVAPALFGTALGPSVGLAATIYTAAIHRDGTVVGHPSLIPGSRPARTGDLISIYGTGFGPTAPRRPAGELIEPAPVAMPFTVRINGNRLSSSFGGIVGPGLYQFNVVMPNVTGTFAYVEVEVAEQLTSFRMVLAVER